MRAVVLFLVALCGLLAFASAQTPRRPVISEMFYAGTDLTIALHNGPIIHGHGFWAADQPEGRNNEFFEIKEESHKQYGMRSLFRYDLHRSYEIVDNRTCHTRVENGSMPALWDWLKVAKNEGKKVVAGHSLDVWGFTMGYAHISVGVTAETPDRPQYLWIEAPGRNTTVRYLSWNTDKPAESLFAVPKQCNRAADSTTSKTVAVSPLACVSRSTMIARAQVWVKNRVPYNQQGYYDGYREDCSGYVSMCWEAAKPGYTTSTMHEIAHPISKGDLQPGDVLLCAGEHVVLFGGWSGGQTHYQAYEETRPGEGTVTRVTPYPYWYNTGCFKPYRFNSVC